MATPKTTPSDIHPCLWYEDAPAAIAWLCDAFGFVPRLVVPGPDGMVMHAELSLGTGVIMVSSVQKQQDRVTPRQLDGRATQALSVHVDDPDAHCASALRAGARLLAPLRDEDYGGRGYSVADPEGHVWYFGNYRPGAWWDGADGSAA